MQPMTEGMNLDSTTLIAVQNERIATAAIREAQLTAAVQQLSMDVIRLEQRVEVLIHGDEVVDEGVMEDEDASADDGG